MEVEQESPIAARPNLIQFDDQSLLPRITTEGVYMVYAIGNPGVVIYAGKGVVAERIAERRKDPRLNPHRWRGTFYLTYASVIAARQENVEAYLGRVFAPQGGRTLAGGSGDCSELSIRCVTSLSARRPSSASSSCMSL